MEIKTGRRPTWGDPLALQQAIVAYFNDCEEHDIFPDYAGMLLKLQMQPEDALALQDEENDNYAEYRRIFNNAKLGRESWLSRHMVADNKKAAGCMNALKQEQNGGYLDRPTGKEKQSIIVRMEGAGGIDAFK